MMGRAGKRATDGLAGARAVGIRAARSWLGIAEGGHSDRDGQAGHDAHSDHTTGPAGAAVAGGPVAAGLVPAGPVPAGAASAASETTVPGTTVPGTTVPGTDPDVTPVAPAAPRDNARTAEVPRWLQVSAGWSWRLLLLVALLYVAGKIATMIYVVVVPFAAAILLSALLQPLTARLRRAGMGPLSATWASLLLAFALIGGVVWLVTTRIEAEYSTLVTEVRKTSTQLQSWLGGAPFHIKTGNLTKLTDNLANYLSQHRSSVEGAAVTGGKIVFELLAGIVLCFFITFFLTKDGGRIWSWLISGLTQDGARRANLAGRAAWQAVVYYVRGTVVVAGIHASVLAITLVVVGSPLVAPLAVLMFIAAFIPLVGMLIAGAVAVLIVVATKGLISAVIVLAVMVVMNQLEEHLLQPQVVGKLLRLHPLAVILALASGAELAGIVGAVVAVPLTASLTAGARALRHDPVRAAATSASSATGSPRGVVSNGEVPEGDVAEGEVPESEQADG
jgi:predicted PurR-regulated permease PerM